MTTLNDQPDATPAEVHAPPREVTRLDAMKFYATGRTAAGIRAYAARFVTVDDVTGQRIDDAVAVKALILAIADGIEQITDEGLTPLDCWKQLGWSPDYAEALLASAGGAR